MGLTYGFSWNNRYYKDYSTAYRDAMDNDPNTKQLHGFPAAYMTEESLDMEWHSKFVEETKRLFRREPRFVHHFHGGFVSAVHGRCLC